MQSPQRNMTVSQIKAFTTVAARKLVFEWLFETSAYTNAIIRKYPRVLSEFEDAF